jgi:cation diffusion facilitator family transporter
MSHSSYCFLYPHVHQAHADHERDRVELTQTRLRSGLRTVGISLTVLTATAVLQLVVFVTSRSVALLADILHNVGDALTAIPVAIALLLRSFRAERFAGVAVVVAILISGLASGYAAIDRLVNPQPVGELGALAAAGVIGFIGNWIAAVVRTRGGQQLQSPALIADGAHAAADAYVSLAAIGSALCLMLGWNAADPLLGLAITGFIGHIAWEAWNSVRAV